MNNLSSSRLISKLESINWSFTFPATLGGTQTIILVKYIFEDDSYGIMLTDFATTYFECSIAEQIDQNYQRFNKAKLNQFNIRNCLKELMKTLPDTVTSIDKIEIDCHTTRITLKCTKPIAKTFSYNWNFYLISTGPDIFFKHFSVPMFRGLMHYYNLSQKQQNSSITEEITDINQFNNSDGGDYSQSSSTQQLQNSELTDYESPISSRSLYDLANLLAMRQMNENLLQQLFRIN